MNNLIIKLINNLKQHQKKFENLKKSNMKYQHSSSKKKLINIYSNFIITIDSIVNFIEKEVHKGIKLSPTMIKEFLYPLRVFRVFDKKITLYKDLYRLEGNFTYLCENFSNLLVEVISQNTLIKQQKLLNIPKHCFAPYADLCNCKGSRNSHTISNSNNFIHEKQNYYTFENRVMEKHIKEKSTLTSIGKNAASASFIFCDYHDPILFSDIENESNIDLSNENHHKLQNYRIYYKREAEDLNSLKIQEEIVKNMSKQQLSSSFISMYIRAEIQRIKEDIDLKRTKINDYLSNNRDNDFFRNNKKENIIYFCISLSQNVEILSSSAGMAKYLNLNIDNDKETIFFHILQNKDNPCIIFSGINTPNIVKTLEEIKNLFIDDSKSFFELVASFSCITDNTFFTQNFFNKTELRLKFENYWSTDNKSLYNSPQNSSIFSNRLFFNKKIELTMEDIKFLFGENYKMVTNI